MMKLLTLITGTGLLLGIMTAAGLCDDPLKTYIGAKACSDCHDEQYASFQKYSKKWKSYASITKMKRGLTQAELQDCYSCHTTGYGKAGGFISEQETPELKNAGCEVCHGPGSLHAQSEDPDDIKGSLSIKDCESCHNEERIGAFNYKPLIYGGAH